MFNEDISVDAQEVSHMAMDQSDKINSTRNLGRSPT